MRQYLTASIIENICFNPRTHEECDQYIPFESCRLEVSIHALTRSATFTEHSAMTGFLFQSTHSRGVRLRLTRQAQRYKKRFNPRTHEECDLSWGVIHKVTRFVSIHALTRSATSASSMVRLRIRVSIHALTRSATVTFDFLSNKQKVSIHALTRSATHSVIV